ncbi:uncharacterized protein LOC118493902 [Sander lucioperca]|uniref:uncharacterized protein LOC118493902 n=1 Tax=Sander lucioperca TaxID=283035 RepID=UPI00165388A2|nr:uncharacterized protein LOC118493902 [Sander lucioperca]
MVQGEKVFWPPYPPKESGKVRAAIRRRDEPTGEWQTYEPVRVLISRDTFEEAERCLERYLKQQCDTTDIQSEEECQQPLKRRKKPNPIYNSLDDSDGDGQPWSKYPQAPKILFPAPANCQTLSTLQFPSPSSQLQPLAPANCQTIFDNPTSYETLPAPASCQSPLPYPNSQPITFSAEDFQFPLQSLPVASAGTPRSPANFSLEGIWLSTQNYFLFLSIDVTLQKLLTTVTELTKEVRDLRQDFREFRQSCRCGQSAGVVGLTAEPLQLPLHSMEELENAEVARFTIIGGTTLEIRVRRMLAYSMTNELASGLNWAGKKNKDVTKQKRSFKEMALCKCMFDALTQRLSTANAYEFYQAVQKWLRYAPDRAGGAGRPTLEI